MIIKIFFQNKIVFLTNELSKVITNLMYKADTIYIDDTSALAIGALINQIEKPAYNTGVIYNNDFEKIKTTFYNNHIIIHAAGGLVKNEMGEILFIYRRGKWDLPKGKNDGGESAKACALREIKEETGLLKVTAEKKICTTHHVYMESDKRILKETEWFNMKSSSKEKLIPQKEEGIEKIEWVAPAEINIKMKNSYALIDDVLSAAGVI